MNNSTLPPELSGLANSDDLHYFLSLQELQPDGRPEDTAQKWNQRAELWKKERINHQKGDARVVSALAFLEQRGVLREHYTVADIGCGPGRFVAAFARRVHRVTGLDISETMVEHGKEHIHSLGLTNAVLRTCDFQTLDVEKEGYRGAFDLVFSSMTPALHGITGLTKAIEMSRAWCCNITHLSGRNLLREQIMQEVFGRPLKHQWTGRWFYSLFNLLFLMGYHPETTYETRHQETEIVPDEEYTAFLMEHMLPTKEHTRENAGHILDWLHAHRNGNGLVTEITDSSYGRILWDVRNRTPRPDYRTSSQGV